MITDKFYHKVEILFPIKGGGVGVTSENFTDCKLTIKENHLIIRKYEENGEDCIFHIFNLSDISRFKTTERDLTITNKK